MIGCFTVLAQLNILSSELNEYTFPIGTSLTRILELIELADHSYAHFQIDGVPILPEYFNIEPKEGKRVILKIVPGKGKNPLSTILGVATLAASLLVPELLGLSFGSLGFSAVGLSIGIAGSLLTSTLVKPPTASVDASAPAQLPGNAALPATMNANTSAQTATVSTLTGFQNQSNPDGVVSRVIAGTGIKVYPLNAAQQYTEIVGNKQYLRALFCLGPGPLNLSDFAIGDTPVNLLGGVTSRTPDISNADVEVEYREGYSTDVPLTLYSNDVAETDLNILLANADAATVQVAPQNADELSVDIGFPKGLIKLNDDGTQSPVNVQVSVDYRLVGASTWVAAPNLAPFDVTETSAEVVRRGIRWKVTNGDYELRIRRVTADSSDITINDEVYLTAIRAIRSVYPIQPIKDSNGNLVYMAVVALRVLATDKLTGVIDQFNCMATSVLNVYNGTAWVQETSGNPVWAGCTVLTESARPADRTVDLDLVGLKAAADICDTKGRILNVVLDTAQDIPDLVNQIFAVGRGTLDYKDGQYSIILDEPQDTPIQLFTPRNTVKDSWTNTFDYVIAPPDAIKILFNNEAIDFQQDQIIVYQDGFSLDGTDPGTVAANTFEEITLWGITNATQAWKEGRFTLFQMLLRFQTYTFNTDFEHFICTRGDRVTFVNESFAIGLGQGRIIAVTLDGSDNCTGVTLDAYVTMDPAQEYALRPRKADGTISLEPIVTNAGQQSALVFVTPITAGDPSIPEVGDLCAFGLLARPTYDLLISAMEPDVNLGCKITCIDYAEAVYGADDPSTGIPTFASIVDMPPTPLQTDFPGPTIINTRSDESVLVRAADGSLNSRILIDLQAGSNDTDYYICRYQRYDPTGLLLNNFQYLPNTKSDTGTISIMNVQDGVAYDIDIEAVSKYGVVSKWVSILNYTVIGKSTPPPDPANPSIHGTLLLWTYDNTPPDFAGFRIKSVAGSLGTWDSADLAHDALVSATQFDISAIAIGTRTYFIKAVDTAGNESVNAAIFEFASGDPTIANDAGHYDYQAAGFPTGVIVGGVVTGGNLVGDTSSVFYGPDTSPMYGPDTASFYGAAVYNDMTYQTTVYHPSTSSIPSTLHLLITVVATAWSVQYRVNGGAWLSWTDGIPATADDYEWLITCRGGSVQPVVSRLEAAQSAPLVTEDILGVSVSAAGTTRLTLTKTYRQINQVLWSLTGTGGSALTVKIADKHTQTDTPPGPNVQALSTSGGLVAATADFTVKGF